MTPFCNIIFIYFVSDNHDQTFLKIFLSILLLIAGIWNIFRAIDILEECDGLLNGND